MKSQNRITGLLRIGIVILLIASCVQVVSASTRIVPAGGVVVIGEQDLDVTRCVFGDTIGWWASPADVNVTSPSRMLTVTNNLSYNVAPSDFIDSTGFRYTGTWYNVNPANGRSYGTAFRVVNASTRVVPAGGVVTIGEIDLDVTRCVFGETIGWWASPAIVNSTSPSRVLTVTSNKSYNVAPSDFIDSTGFRYTGTWYNLNPAGTRPSSVAFRVVASLSPPVAADDSYSLKKSTVLRVPPDGVLKNDNNPAGLTLTAVKVKSPKHGKVILNAEGSFTYTPDKGYVGTDSFTYKAYDGQSYSNTAAVKLTIRR